MRTNRIVLSVVVLLLAGTAAGGDWLVRVNGPAPAENVVFAAEGWSLVRAGDADVEALARASVDFQLLDAWPDGRGYVFAYCPDDVTRARAAACGRVVGENEEGLILAADADVVGALDCLPLELCGIGPHARPAVFDPAGPVPAALPDSLMWELVGRVSADTLEAQLVRMREFRTRYSTTDSCRSAVEWFRQRLLAYGCDSAYLDTFRTDYAPSAVGVKRGTLHPDEVFVVCGHVDATSESQHRYTNTPGSDDNASGAGAVLELARVMRDMSFEKTAWFIGFSGEEQGLVGSDSLARRARDRGDSIRLAVNFDMISYARENKDSIVIYGASNPPNSVAFVEFFRAQADTFTDLKHYATIEGTPEGRSDHYSFWKYGFPAIRGGYHDRTPKYHTIGDTIGPFQYEQCGTNNIPMYAEVVKALVATMAKLAGAEPRVGIAGEPDRSAAEFGLPTVVRASDLARFDLRVMDASGRDVTGRRGQLGPGVYFVRPAVCGERPAGTRKVIVER